jgi:hypothetical protein
MKLHLELPQDAKSTDRDFVPVLNQRLRRIAEFLGNLKTTLGGIVGELDMEGRRIINLGTARLGTDAVNVGFGDARWSRLGHKHEKDEDGIPDAGEALQTLFLSRQGTLAVESSVFPLFRLAAARTPTEVVAMVKDAPTGADLVIEIQVDGVTWQTVTIVAGATSKTVNTGLGQIAANKDVVVNLTRVGTTFPGADLTLLVRWVG